MALGDPAPQHFGPGGYGSGARNPAGSKQLAVAPPGGFVAHQQSGGPTAGDGMAYRQPPVPGGAGGAMQGPLRPGYEHMGRGTMPDADPYQLYLMNQAGLQNLDYAALQAQLGLDAGFSTGMYDVRNAAAQAQLGLTNRGIGIDQNRANALWQLAQQDAGARGGFADARWTELQRNNQQNVGFSGRELGLNLQDIGLSYDKSYRQSATDATARGARTSRGYSDSIEEFQRGRDIDTGQANLSHEQRIESLLNQYNNGKITWQEAKHAIDQSLGGARVGYEHSTASSDLARDTAQAGYTDAQLRNALEYWQAQSQIGTESQRAANQRQQQILAGVQHGYNYI